MRNVTGCFNKKGFTLAEVLITLAIIGVVASIILPNLMQNAQKEEYANKTKKVYTTLEQAVKLSEIDNGPWEKWYFGSTVLNGDEAVAFGNTYLRPYLKISKYCGKTSGCWIQPKTWGGSSSAYSDNTQFAKFILEDGSAIHIATNTTWAWIHFDINGAKGPNIYGKDVFVYSIQPGLRLGVGAFYGWSRDALIGNNANACTKTAGQPDACLMLIIQDGWQIKGDYPW